MRAELDLRSTKSLAYLAVSDKIVTGFVLQFSCPCTWAHQPNGLGLNKTEIRKCFHPLQNDLAQSHFDEVVLAVVVGTDLYIYLYLLLRIVLGVHVGCMFTPLCNLLIQGVLKIGI